MKRRKMLAVLALALSITGILSACSFGGDSEEQVVIEDTPTPEPKEEAEPTPTIAPDAQESTVYTSADKTMSIQLPDATWSNKTDEDGILSFESPSKGKIVIEHGTGDAYNSAVIPDSQDMAVSLEKAAGFEEGTDFEVSVYSSENVNGSDVISYTVNYTDTEKSEGIVTNLYKYYVNDSEYISITASAYQDDGVLISDLDAAVRSFSLVGGSTLTNSVFPERSDDSSDADASGDTGTETGDTDSAGSNSGNYTAEQLADTNQTRTIYAVDGSPVVVTPNDDGTWSDSYGNTYRFADDGETVYNQNDEDFWYGGEAGDVAYMPLETE